MLDNLDRPAVAMIFFVGLVALFLILVMITIAMIVGNARRKRQDDIEEDDDIDIDTLEVDNLEEEYTLGIDESAPEIEDIFSEAEEDVSTGALGDNYDAMSDSAFGDDYDAMSDSAFGDDYDAMGDSAFGDNSAFDSLVPDAPTNELDTEQVKQMARKDRDRQREAQEENLPEAMDERAIDEDVRTEVPVAGDDVPDAMDQEDTVNTPDAVDAEDIVNTMDMMDDEDTVNTSDVMDAEDTVNAPDAMDQEDIVNTLDAVDTADTEDTSNGMEEAKTEDTAPVQPSINYEAIAASVREAEEMSAAIKGDLEATTVSAATMFGINEELSKFGAKKNKRERSNVSSDEDFFWYNKEDMADRPSHRKPELYYHYFGVASDCIEDLLVEMYDCALVRTEEIRYIAYGIEPKAYSMKEIMSDSFRLNEGKKKMPSTQDLVRIYEKWCTYVDKLFDKVEIHADEYTIQEIRKQLCAYGKSDVDILIEGK